MVAIGLSVALPKSSPTQSWPGKSFAFRAEKILFLEK